MEPPYSGLDAERKQGNIATTRNIREITASCMANLHILG
jgi:hypothetical protein